MYLYYDDLQKSISSESNSTFLKLENLLASKS